MDQMFTIKQVANVTGAKVRTVREWIRLGKINGEKIKGGRWYFTEEEVNKACEMCNRKKRGRKIGQKYDE